MTIHGLPNAKFDHGFAIVRIDNFDAYPGIAESVTVNRVVCDKDLGIEEIERPNNLNQDKGCKYIL